MLPGMNKLDDGMLKSGEEQLKKVEAMIGSMTPDERRETLGEIRRDRAKSKKIQRTSTKQSRQRKVDKISALLNGMSDEERKKLLGSLKK